MVVLIFICTLPVGAVSVVGGNLGNQVIQSLSIPGSDQSYFRSIIARCDSLINLDFREAPNASSADVDVYYDQKINLDGSGPGTTLGLCLINCRD